MSVGQLLLLSGAVGAGKSSVARALNAAHGFQSINSGAHLRSISGASSRGELQTLGDRLDSKTDFRWLIDDVAAPTIRARPNETRWLLDAVRKQRQVEHFRDRFGPAVRHIHLYAQEEILVLRYIGREGSDLTDYEAAVRHPNEKSARALFESADASYDSSLSNAEEIAETIVRTWEKR